MIRHTTHSLARVVVLGGGYAGVKLMESLDGDGVDLTLVDRKPYHTEKTRLWKMAVGEDEDAIEPLARLAEKAGAHLQLGEVRAIDANARQVTLEGGAEIPYDYLVVALGSRPCLPAQPEWANAVLTIDQPEDAQRIRDTVRTQAQAALSGSEPLRMVVVGGGATGVELAGVVHEVVAQVSPSLLDRLDLCLVHAGQRLVNGMPEEVSRQTTAAMESMGVRLILGERVTRVQEGEVELGSGEKLPASCILWATGTRAPELLAELGGKTDRAGRVEVSEHLTLPEHPEVFIIGDAALARCDGQVVPPDKRAAKKEAAQAARNIQNAIEGRPMEPFRYRDDKGWSHIGPVHLD